MKYRSMQRFWLAVGLTIAFSLHAAIGAEKIRFSSSKEEKKANLSLPQTKPALQTLDFSRMGGRPSKAEELAPVARPSFPLEAEDAGPEDKQKEKDWLVPNRKDGKDGEDRDQRKDKNRDEKSKRQEYDRLGDKKNDPFRRDDDENDPFNPFSTSESSTNRIVFGSSNPREEQVMKTRRPEGAPIRELGQPPDPRRNPLDEPDRTSTLERLGFTPRTAPLGTGPGAGSNAGSPSATYGLGVLQGNRSTYGGQVSPVGPIGGFSEPGSRAMSGPDSSFRSGLPGGIDSLNQGPSGGQPKIHEAPKYERKPAVLPIPQRKF